MNSVILGELVQLPIIIAGLILMIVIYYLIYTLSKWLDKRRPERPGRYDGTDEMKPDDKGRWQYAGKFYGPEAEEQERQEAEKKKAAGKKTIILVLSLVLALCIAVSSGVIIRNSRLNRLYETQAENLKDVMVGDTLLFGEYEQDNDESDGKEEIEWIVLAVEDDRALLISRYALDFIPYQDSRDKTMDWNVSSLRRWLNYRFYYTAFGPEHMDTILTTTQPQDQPGEIKTDDMIFILSHDEADTCMSGWMMKCSPTAYSAAQGLKTDSDGTCWWWVRSYGFTGASVRKDTTQSISEGSTQNGVRPAMWIKLK